MSTARIVFSLFAALLLFAACSKSPEETAREELATMGVAYDSNGFIECARKGDKVAVDWFLVGGMDHNVSDRNGVTPLMAGAQNGHTEIVTALLFGGADALVKNKEGWTACGLAVRGGHTDTVNVFLEEAPELTPEDNRESINALLRVAATNNRIELVRPLLAHGADVNGEDQHGRTALLFAALGDHEDAARLLLDNGADPNIGTPLMVAAIKRDTDLVRALVEAGADVDARAPRDGYTALMYSARLGDVETVNLLLASGADLNAKNKHGESALRVATDKGHADVVQLLNQAGAAK
jgi:ankyrin repeat protein